MSSRGGNSTFKGVNAQATASLSLFLQYVTQSNFKQIELEQDGWEDFVLLFDDGKKIICESKYRSKQLDFNNLRTILEKIQKHKNISKEDDILIITENINPEVKSAIDNFKYYGDIVKDKLKNKKHKFTDDLIDLFPKVKIWEVSQKISEGSLQLLMAHAFNINGSFWLPQSQLSEWTKSILFEDIYKGSEEQRIITREYFLNKLQDKKSQFLKDAGNYDYEDEKRTNAERVEEILTDLKVDSKRAKAGNEIARLSVNSSLHYFTLQKLLNTNDLKLEDWHSLWEATLRGNFSSELFKIFEKNLGNDSNRKYVLTFIENSLDNYSTNFYREEFIKKDMVDVCKIVLKNDKSSAKHIFKILQKLFSYRIEKFLFSKRRRNDSWEREEISKLFSDIYDKTSDADLKNEIVKYILDNFNIVADDGKYWHYTPPVFFEILSKFVLTDPRENLSFIKGKCIRQYEKYYQKFSKKVGFDGWEHMGGGISQSGSEFSINDKHFVRLILTPAIEKVYQETDGWQYITGNLITLKQEDIKKEKPDFLNRASLSVVLKAFKSKTHSKEALKILTEFIKMRKGIPWKNDLIFQAVDSPKFTDTQKWRLIKVSLDAFNNLPVNVFVERIVSDLASKAKVKSVKLKATQMLKDWQKNPDYHSRHNYGELDTVDGAIKMINSKDSLDDGISLLEEYIESDHFINQRDTFEAYDVAKALSRVIELKPEKGLEILKSVNNQEQLSTNQQILLSSSLYKFNDNNADTLKVLFDQFVEPMLRELIGEEIDDVDELTQNDYLPVEQRFSYRYARESLIQFGEKMARVGYKKEALWMVKIFILDSDPHEDGSNNPDDENGEFNQHLKISRGEKNLTIGTVRGHCAWVLQKLVVPFSKKDQPVTQEVIPDSVKLVKKLCFSNNYYLRAEGCVPLIELVKNRHTHLPDNISQRFISEELAQEIEDIAFDMLTTENLGLNYVAKHLAMVFSHIRTMGSERAKIVLTKFLSCSDEDVISEILPLLIFFAVFRKESFDKWQWSELEPFNEEDIEELLTESLSNGNDRLKSQLAWQFERLPDEIKKIPEEKRKLSIRESLKLTIKYLEMLLNEYNHDAINHIYRLVEDYHEEYFDLCFPLWEKCIDLESRFFEENWSEDKLHELYWYPFFYNGRILISIADNIGSKEFIKQFKKLANYPVPVLIANDLEDAVKRLVAIKGEDDEVEQLFEKLIERNPKYYEYKQEWEKLSKNER